MWSTSDEEVKKEKMKRWPRVQNVFAKMWFEVLERK